MHDVVLYPKQVTQTNQKSSEYYWDEKVISVDRIASGTIDEVENPSSDQKATEIRQPFPWFAFVIQGSNVMEGHILKSSSLQHYQPIIRHVVILISVF